MVSTTKRLAPSWATSLAPSWATSLALLLLVASASVSCSPSHDGVTPATADMALAQSDILGRTPTYESDFFALDRSIVGRATTVVSTLTKNQAVALNLQPGSTACYMVQREAMFGDDGDGNGRPGRNPSQPNAEARSPTLYLSANTCLQPSHASSDSKKKTGTPQLILAVSNSSETACKNSATLPKDGEGKTFTEGAVMFSLNMTGDLFVGITAPNVSSDFRGIYNFELGASPDDFLHRYEGEDRSELLWMDSDSTSAILATRNLTEDESEITRVMNQALPYELYVSNDEALSSAGLRHSYCGLRNTAQIRASQSSNSEANSPVKTVVTRRGPGGFPKQQFHFVSLNASSRYTGILVKKPREDGLGKRQDNAADSGPGSVVFRATEFETITGSSCKIVTDLEFCDEIQYAVPGNDRRFNNTALGKAYDDYARKMYANFEKPTRSGYAPSVCRDFPNGTQLAPEVRGPLEQRPPTNSSRNRFIDEEIQPGPYKEILPCEDLCYEVVQSCPARIGFKCPRPEFPGFDTSYGRRDQDPATVSCNFAGEARTPISGGKGLLPELGWAGGVSLVVAAAQVLR
ncbi:hypothetical protein XA68_15698 [Ophiocordyceps unilateralis]|uniref:Uncharacterized protein n=1 Tax=Ophiocordyceps unilateralis TaxID=268505 RepID=A0A2A9PM92_OPHUN|nr:hypothetical protein XA68_15698 [Ophiocordyceps unilateralis]